MENAIGVNGEVIVRQLIVPDQDIVIDDTIICATDERFFASDFYGNCTRKHTGQ